MKNIKFDFNDILIQPVEVSEISSRDEVNPYYSNGHLPLITAPMDTVIGYKNQNVFVDNKIIPCQPRGVECGSNGFTSYSLSEFRETFLSELLGITDECKILIDIANGHMKTLVDTVREAKKTYPMMQLMVGNIANPKTFKRLSDAGADYIRVGIGNGGGCLTTEKTGVGYPMASLINECYVVSLKCKNSAKIVADGGMKTESDIIKALALGADYVMLGSILNKAIESIGQCYTRYSCTDMISDMRNGATINNSEFLEIDQDAAKELFINGTSIYKEFRGMSTKEVQKKWGNTTLKTSEGVTRMRRVEYTLEQWVENFEHYLKSAMSYSNAKTLYDFKGFAKFNFITNNAYKRFNK
jgi:IMP dehydrogenase/GMP reductase